MELMKGLPSTDIRSEVVCPNQGLQQLKIREVSHVTCLRLKAVVMGIWDHSAPAFISSSVMRGLHFHSQMI